MDHSLKALWAVLELRSIPERHVMADQLVNAPLLAFFEGLSVMTEGSDQILELVHCEVRERDQLLICCHVPSCTVLVTAGWSRASLCTSKQS